MTRRLGVLAIVYAVHLVVALAFAWPAAGIFVGEATRLPRGDLALFEPGALHLLEAARLAQTSMTRFASGSTLGVFVVLYLGLLPLGALIYALSRNGRLTLSSLVAAGARYFGTFSLLLGLSLVTALLASLVPATAAGLLETKAKMLGDRNGDVLLWVIRSFAFVLIVMVLIIQDLARAAAVLHELPAIEAARVGATAFRNAPARAFGAWALRATVGVLLVIAVWLLTARLGVATAPRFAIVVLLHQATIFGLLLLRAGWLAWALRLVSP